MSKAFSLHIQKDSASVPHIQEPSRDLPVRISCDVVVAGGGIAGVAAAIASARQGVHTVLIEKQCGLGGLATLGHVVMYLPLCDGYGKQVMGGLAEEFIQLADAGMPSPLPSACFTSIPDCWKNTDDLPTRERKRYMNQFNPFAFQCALEHAVEKAGVDLLYDTRVCQVTKENTHLTHLIIENKSGRSAIFAKTFIDASGDGDMAFLAGCSMENYTYNVLAGWFYEVVNEKLKLVKMTRPYDKEHRGERIAEGPFFSGTEERDVTQHVLQSRKLMQERIAKQRAMDPSATIHPFAFPSIPCFRVTRRLHNRFSLSASHCHQWFDDCIGITGDWRFKGPIYALPLRSIQSDTIPNLFAVGRCMSSDHTVIDATRAIGTCAVTGEAAGVAAAMKVKEKIDTAPLPIEKLQATLQKQGVLIHPDLVQPHPKAKDRS